LSEIFDNDKISAYKYSRKYVNNITLTVILEMFSEKCRYNSNDSLIGLCKKAEIIISYIKVFTRPFLSKYHHIRQAMLKILLVIFEGMTTNDINHYIVVELPKHFSIPDLDNFKSFFRVIKKFDYLKGDKYLLPSHQYQVFITIIKRLSYLESKVIFSRDSISKVFNAWENIKDKYGGRMKK